MEVDFWPSNFQSAAKHFSPPGAARLTHSDNYLHINDSEGDEDARVFFPCPFCYVDVDIQVLCGHLQEEHCFVLRDAVCPICAANLGKDVIGHFTVQHAHSVKRRRKCQKSGFWTNSPAIFGKDLDEPSLFLGSNLINGRGNLHESAPDPLLSPFLFTMPLCDPKDNQQYECSSESASTASDMISTKSSVDDEIHEEDYEERRQRAAFCQQLIMSTIF